MLIFSLFLVIHTLQYIDLMEGTQWIPTSWYGDDLSVFEQQYICNDKNGPYLGLIDHNIQKQLPDLGAHYSLQISIDILFTGRWEGTNKLEIHIDQYGVIVYTLQSSSTFICPYNYCQLNTVDSIQTNQKLITELYSISHEKRNPLIKIIGSFSCDIALSICQTLVLKNIVITTELCHFTCLTCNGPDINNCITCPYNIPISGQCYCPTGQYSYNNKCVLGCPKYYISNIDNQCILQCSLNCKICQSSIKCNICEDGYYNHQGQCLQNCPIHSIQQDQKCIDYSEMKTYGSEYIVKMFYTLESNYQVQTNAFEFQQQYDYSMQTGQKYSIYNNQILLGGYGVWSEGLFNYNFYGLSSHNKLRIYLDVWFIDDWNNEKFYISVDNIIVYEIQSIQTQNLFYNSDLDNIEQIILEIDHISDNVNIKFVSELQKSSFIASVGITNLFILIDYCDNQCQICTDTQCQICNPPYKLINNKCTLCDSSYLRNSDCTCLIGYYEQNQAKCIKCRDECETCLDEYTCIDCRIGSHLINLPLCQNCEIGYYYDNSICQNCRYNCQTCIDFNTCISCIDGFINPPYCQCQQGYYENTQQICVKCNYQCKTCQNDAEICTSCAGNRLSLPDCSCPPFSIEISNSIWCSTCQIASLDITLLNQEIIINFYKQLKQVYTKCSYLFNESTIQIIGQDAICQQDSDKIIILLGKEANIKSTDEIIFYSNRIQFQDCQEQIQQFYNTQIRFLAQSDTYSQQLILSENTIYLSRCAKQQKEISLIKQDDQVFKLIQWKIISFINKDNQLNNFIDLLNQQIQQVEYRNTFKIPQNLLEKENQIILELEYTNFLNQIYQIQITIIQELDVISTQIDYQRVPYSLSQQIIIKIQSFKCPKLNTYDYDTSLNYVISLNCELYSYDSNLDQNLMFNLEAQKIGIGIYEMIIQTIYKDKIVKQQNFKIQIIEEPKHLIIYSDGNAFNYKSQISLKAELIGSREDVKQFNWECYDVNEEKLCQKNSKILELGNQNEIIIPSNTFLPFQIIIISVNYQNLRESIQIQIVEIDVPKLNHKINTQPRYINYYDNIDIQLLFTDIQVNPDRLQYIGILYTTDRIIAQFNFYYLELKFQIWDYINLNELTKKLTLKISIHNPEYFLPSTTQMNIYINIPPQQCKISVYPFEGESMITDFQISINDCDDDNKPLQYRLLLYQNYSDLTYDYQIGQLYKGLVLYDYQWDSFYQTKLVGNGQVFLLVQVMDTLKGISNFTTNITINISKSNLQESHTLTGSQDLKTSILYALNSQNNNETIPQDLEKNSLKSSICDCGQDINQQLYLKKLLLMQGTQTTTDQIYSELITSNNKLQEIEQKLNYQTSTLMDNKDQTQYNQIKLQEYVVSYAQYISELFNQNQKLIKQNRRLLEESGAIINQQVLDSVEILSNIQLNKQSINAKKSIIQTNGFNITTQKVTSKLLQQAFGNILQSQSSQFDDIVQNDINTTIFEYKMTKFNSNPYYYDQKFQELNINNSNYILYQPQVKYQQNQSLLLESQSPLLYEFPKQLVDSYQECIVKIEDSWSVDACKTKNLGTKTICECQTISIITLIDAVKQLSEELTSFFSINTLQKISNCDYEEFLFLYIIIFYTIVLVVFIYYGDKMDEEKQQNSSFHSAKIIPQSFEEIQDKRKSSSSINEIAQIESERLQMKTTKDNKRSSSIHFQKDQIDQGIIRQTDSACSSKRNEEQQGNKIAEETECNNPSGIPILASQSHSNSPKREESILIQVQNKKIKMHKGFIQFYKISHNLLSLYFLYKEDHSRLYRAIIAYLSLIGEMCILIFFGKIISLNTIIALSILQSIFGLIFSKMFSYLIHNKNKKLKIIGSILAVLCILFFYFLLLGSLARYKTIIEAQYWALAYLSSVILNYMLYSLIIQFIIFSLLIKYGNRKNFKKIMKYILDEKIYDEVFGKQN